MASTEITRVLERVRLGDRAAMETLVDLVYGDLKRIAKRELGKERGDHTLQPTALVHETYLRLLGKSKTAWENRAHFFGAAATAMRHILVDHARATRAQRRGGGRQAVPIEETSAIAADETRLEEVLAVDEVLDRLEQISARQKTIVEMRFYAGCTEEEIAEMLQLSTRTVKREWAVARAWLHGECAGLAARKAAKASELA